MPGPVTPEDLQAAVDDLVEAFDEQMVAARQLFDSKLDALAVLAGAEGATLRALIAQKMDAVIAPLQDTAEQLPVLTEETTKYLGERLATEIAIAKMPRRHSRIRHGAL